MFTCFGISNIRRPKIDPEIVWDAKANDELPDDAHILRTNFPDVVWNRIAEKIKTNKYQNFINSSPFFRHLQLNKRVLYLAQDVLELVVKNDIGLVCLNGPTWSYKNEKDGKSILLNIRLICKLWRNAVGNLARISHPNWKLIPEPDYSKQFVVSNLLRKPYEFSSISKVEMFLDVFGKFTVNPIVGRSVTVFLAPVNVPNRQLNLYHSLITSMLQTFGSHILHCEIYSTYIRSAYEAEQIYNKMVNWLWNMPNLKRLGITIHSNNEFNQHPVLNSIPKFRRLKTLSLKCVSGSFANKIIGNNLHVEEINLKSSLYNFELINLHYNFVKLETLELTILNRELKNFVVPKWSFKKLKLRLVNDFDFGHYVYDFEIDWNTFFELLQTQFGGILDDLEIELPNMPRPWEFNNLIKGSFESRMNLDVIRKLSLSVQNRCIFDFLLGLKETLEFLSITWKVGNATANSGDLKKAKKLQKLKLVGFEKNLYRSNIWVLFPKLNIVCLNRTDEFKYKYQRRIWTAISKSKRKGFKIFN